MRALVVVQHLNPKPQHQSCRVEMCLNKAMLDPGAVLHLHLPGLVLIIFTEKMGCSCPMHLVSLNTKCLALDILLSLVTVITPHPRRRSTEMLFWKICFPNSFIVSVWPENQAALAEGKCLCSATFSFPGCV